MPSRVSLRLDLPLTPTTSPVLVRRARVVNEAGSHLLANVDVLLPSSVSVAEGDPVRLTWGFRSNPDQSLMYVHRVGDPSSRVANGSVHRLMLVGATWPLKSSNQRVLQGRASQVLRTIAEDHDLAHRFTAVDRSFDNFVSRESDWMALRDLARRTGGMLRAEGAGVRIFDVNDGIDRAGGAPVFSATTHQISAFHTTARRQDVRKRVSSTVHPNTGSVVTVDDRTSLDSSNPLLTSRGEPRAGDPREVEDDIRALRLHERLRETAEIPSMVGSIYLRPGEVVGFNSPRSTQNGFWTVTKASHTLTEMEFITSLELGRSADHPRDVPPPSPIRTASAAPSLGRATLRGNRWVAA